MIAADIFRVCYFIYFNLFSFFSLFSCLSLEHRRHLLSLFSCYSHTSRETQREPSLFSFIMRLAFSCACVIIIIIIPFQFTPSTLPLLTVLSLTVTNIPLTQLTSSPFRVFMIWSSYCELYSMILYHYANVMLLFLTLHFILSYSFGLFCV